MNFLHKTKGGAPINGKQLIFVHAAESDHGDRDRVIQMILDSENGGDYAVLFTDENAFPIDFGTPEMSRINLYVPIITKEYLKRSDNGLDFSKLSAQYGFDILPVVQNADLIPAFNERFKNIHAITLTMQNPALEIEKLLSRMLVSAKLIEEIVRDGFTRRLFLSYRKKDKAEVERIMRAVHNTKWGKAAAIWFDDFLVPGTDFESGINEAMSEADAVVFAVTNNLPKPNAEGKKNYVCEHEYPDAVKLGKETIAVETEPTPRRELDDALGEDFPQSIPVDDKERMDAVFDKLGDEEPDPDPYVQYLRAMAFLIGVRVERDPAKAIKMLDKCVDKGVYEAAMQMCDMYAYGRYVSQDIKTASEYREKAYHIICNRKNSYERLALLNDILLGHGGDSADVSFDTEKRDEYYEKYLKDIDDYLQNKDTIYTDEIRLWQAETYINLGNVENRPNADHDILRDYLMKADRILLGIKNRDVEFYRVRAMLYSIRSSLARSNNDKNDFGVSESMQAASDQRYAADLEPTWGARWRLVTYQSNAMGCKYISELSKNRHALLSRSDAWEIVEECENLYKEKKNPQLATELITLYKNMLLTTKDKDEKRKYTEKAYDRVRDVRCDFRYYPPLRSLENELEAEVQKYKKFKLGKLRIPLPNDDTLMAARLPLAIVQCLLSAFIGFFSGRLADFLPVIMAVTFIPLPFFTGKLKPGWRVLVDVIVLIGVIAGIFLIPNFADWSTALKLLYLIGIYLVTAFV